MSRPRAARDGAAEADQAGTLPAGWSLFEAYTDPAVILGPEGRILAANEAAVLLTGVAGEVLVGSELSAHFTEPDLVTALQAKALSDGRVAGALLGVRHPSGTVADVVCGASVYRGADGRTAGLLVGLHDVTEARQIDRRLSMLAAASQALVRAQWESALLEEICEITTTMGGYLLSWVGAAVPEGKRVIPLARAGPGRDYLERVCLSWDDGPLGQGPTGQAVRTGAPAAARDVEQDPAMAPWRDEAVRYGFGSSLAVPFDVDGQRLVFHAYLGRPDAFGDAELAALRQLAGNLAVGLGALRSEKERRRAEEALRRSRALLDDVEQITHVGGWEYDAFTGAAAYTDEACRIHGLEPQTTAISPESSSAHYPPEDRERIVGAFGRAVRDGEPYDLELRLIAADGRDKWIRTIGRAERRDGQVVRVYGNIIDATVQHRQQEALRESAEQFRTLFEQSPVGVAYVALDGTFVRVNRRFGEITGYGGDLEQLSFHTISHPDDLQANLDWQRRVIDGESDSYSMEKRYIRKDGSAVWVDLFSTLVRDEQHRPVHFVSVVQDIDDRKRAEHEVNRLTSELEDRVRALTASNEQLRVANRELESFTYTVSHDLRAPLRHTAAFTQILIEDHGRVLDAEGRRLLDVIQASTQRLGQLIDDLLEFSRIGRQPLARDPVDMTALARGVAAELCAAEPGRDIRIEADDLPPASGDANLLTQVWTNLLANAVKFTSAREQALVTVSGAREQGHAVYHVTDNGIGFDMAYADKLFEIFQRLHPRADYPGTGVGLAIVARVVARHGGQVSAASEAGRGATFTFTLPLAGEGSP